MLGTDKLVRYSLLAGERALGAHAYEEALGYFRRTLTAKEGCEMDAETADLPFGLGRAQLATFERHQPGEVVANLSCALDYYVETGDVPRAVAVAEHPLHAPSGLDTGATQLIARALALVPSDSHEAGRLLLRQGEVMAREKGYFDAAQEVFRQALAIAQHEGDVALEMRTLAESVRSDFAHLRYQECLEKGLRIIELAHRVDEPGAEVSARFSTARVLMIIGDLEEASRHGAAMLALAERMRDRFWLASALWQNERNSYIEGDWHAARAFNDRGLAVFSGEPRLLGTRVQVEYQVGDFSQGEAHLERLLEVVRLTPPGPNLIYAYPAIVIPMVAWISGVADRLDVAEAAAEAVLSSPSATPLVACMARSGLALLAALRCDVVAAGEQYTALEPKQGTMLPLPMAMAADRVLGLLSQTMGKLDQAAAHFEDALAFCRKAGYRPELAWSCCDYSDLLRERDAEGDRAKAISLLDESLAISTELGMRPLMERVLSRREILGA